MPDRCGRSIDQGLAAAFPLLNTPPGEVKGQDLLQAALKYYRLLAESLERLRSQARGRRATALLETLIVQEKREIVNLKKMMAMDYF